jgi:prenylcysteine oxidase/farnesylcysteine lyase
VKEEVFDAVIIGTPLEFAGIELHDINAPPMREYQITHVTFVAGKLQPKYFGLSPEDELPDLIGTIESPKIPFSSIG